MESQRRLFFKKQIMKELSEQKTEETICAEIENRKNNEADEDCVTLLGSQSYYDQIQRFSLVNTIPSAPDNSNMEKVSQDDQDTKDLLEDITNKDLTKEMTFTENIRIEIEFESVANTQGAWNKENSSDAFPQEESDERKLIFNCEKIDREKEPELISTLTEVIDESEMELLRKSLEADEEDIGAEKNYEENDDHVQSKKRSKNNRSKNEKNDGENEPELVSTFTGVINESEMELLRNSLEADEHEIGTDSGKLKKKSRTRKINKSYVDFLSEEEDFVWDSSSWKETGDESSSNESNEPRRKKKKVRPEDGKVGEAGLKKEKKNKRKEAKNMREKGKQYMKKDGSIVSARLLKPNPCIGKNCSNHCYNVSEEKRQNIFEYFWELPSQRKRDWLVGMTAKTDIKRKRIKDSGVRHNTYFYYINDGEGRRKVCKKFLVDTLGVSSKYVSYTLANASAGLSKEDRRGKIVPKNKTPQIVKESAINFIKSLPAIPSHYCRKDSTRLYLPTELKNITNLYRIYKQSKTSEGIDVVGEKVFRDIFNKDFNIGFHIPKKDKCVKCLRFEGQKEKEDPEMFSHLKEKKASKDRLAFHSELSKKNDSMLCTSFDLQKVLNTPHGDSMLLFYSRKYTVYNLCFYESGTRNGFCYTWGETEGKRGGNETATILRKYIAEVDSRGSVRNLILYSDSCPGQNKNKIVLAALHNALLVTKHIETIQMNYLLPGHTEMAVDSVHATIENSIRNTIIWAPSQWSTVFQLARKDPCPYYVETLTHGDFMNYEEFSEKYFKGNLTGKISKVRVATFKKSSPHVMTVKYSMDKNAETESIAIISRPKVLHPKYKTSLPITTAKYKDLKKLCDTGIIPKIFHVEYLNFPHRNGTDVLIDTDIEDNLD